MKDAKSWEPRRLASMSPLRAIGRLAATGLLAASCSAASAQPSQPGGPARAVLGTWSGDYVCTQGLTGVTLSITRGRPDDVRALFHFYEAPGNPGVPTGCFEMGGTYDPATGELRLAGGRWLLRPQGYVVVDFVGRIDPDGGEFEGRVEGVNCTTFRLARRPSPRPVPAECRPETVAAR